MPKTSTTFPPGNGPGKGPAKGAGRGGAAQGIGAPERLYGPAKGEQPRGEKAEPFKAGQPPPSPNPNGSASERRAQRTAAIEDHLFHLALKAKDEKNQVAAGRALHAIINGAPVARNLNANVDDIAQLSDEAIRAELAGGGGEEG